MPQKSGRSKQRRAYADSKGRPRRALRADAAKNLPRVLDAAAQTLAVDSGASMSQIAEAAGLHRTSLYRHFKDRDSLIHALRVQALDDALAAITSASPEDGTAREALERIVENLLPVGDRYQVLLGMPDEKRLREQQERVGTPLISLIERGQGSGEFRDDYSARWLVGVFASILDRALRTIADGEMEGEEPATVVVETFVDGAGCLNSGSRGEGPGR